MPFERVRAESTRLTDPDENMRTAAEGRVYRSAALAVAIAWSMRLIGLVSVFVLARTLTPADFGIVALAMATLAIVDVFSALGLRQALLRKKDPDRSYYDTVWTIQLLVLACLAVIVVALGPVVAWIYDEPALIWVIAILATRFLFYGLANIGTIDFERNLEFGRDLKMRLSVRLITFFATIAAALILRNHWALVLGAVLQGVLYCGASYVFHPFRPRFSLARRAEMLGVSVWMFLASAAQTVQTEIERFVVGRIGSLDIVGFYSVSKDLSSIFTQEIATALNRVTFVTTAKTGMRLGDAPARLQSMLGAYALIAAPLGVGLAATSEDAVAVLLGAQWAKAAPFLEFIAPAAAFYAVFKLVVSSLQASGKAKLAALLAIGSAAIATIAIGVIVSSGGSPLDMAAAVLLAMGAVLFVALCILAREEEIGAAKLLLAAGRPFLAAMIMYLVVTGTFSGAGPSIVSLTSNVALGAVSYLVSVCALWIIGGRPDGAEANANAILAAGWSRIRA